MAHMNGLLYKSRRSPGLITNGLILAALPLHAMKNIIDYFQNNFTPHFQLLAHPAFRPQMSLCHRVASVVCCLSTIHKKCFSSLNSYPISMLFALFERARACA